MKIVHLTTVHSPDDTRIFHKECRSLADAGHQVTLVAPAKVDAHKDGVQIAAIPVVGGRRARLTKTLWSAYRRAVQARSDVYHFHDPELIPVGLALELVHRKPVVYDVHEDLPRDIYTKDYIPVPLRWSIARVTACVEWLGGRVFSGISAATTTIAQRFPAAKTIVLQNFPRVEELANTGNRPYAQRDPVIAYMGGIARIRGVQEMVDAMERLGADRPVRLEMAGAFQPPALEAEMKARPGWANVQHLGWLDRGGIAGLLGRARLGMVTLHPMTTYLDAQPVKLYEYMAAALPVVASDFPRWRRIVGDEGCGLLVDPLNPCAIAEAVGWLLDNPGEAEEMGRRGRQAVLSRYNWEVEERKLLGLYERLRLEG